MRTLTSERRSCLPILFASALAVTGCAQSDEGAITYRKAEHVAPTATVPQPMLKLEWKNYSSGDDKALFKEKDSISVHLRSALIKDFFEIPINPLRGFESNGEIAIVANVFEQSTGKELDQSDQVNGRLVFYSDDVEKGQFLNFNNMPIYGPITYEGRPLAFRMMIFELDESTEQSKKLLDTLAKVGGTAYPPAGPVLGILNGLGKSLLDGQQNDTEFRYTAVLDPTPGVETLRHTTLEVGNYVLIRSEDRRKAIPWDDLYLNENEARVYWKPAASSGKKGLFLDDTYLVVEINKVKSSVDIDLAQNTFADLIRALREQDKKDAERFDVAANTIIEASYQRAQVRNFNAAKDLLAKVRDEKTNEVTRITSLKRLLSLIRGSYEIDAETNTAKIIETDVAAKKQARLDLAQTRYILEDLRNLASEKGKPAQTILPLLDPNGDLLNTAKDKEILGLFAPAS